MRSDEREPNEVKQAIDALPLAAATKRRYRSPVLQDLGPVVEHTLANTPGTFESGPGAGFRGSGG